MSDAMANDMISRQTNIASFPSSMCGQEEYLHTKSASNVSAYAAQKELRFKKYRAMYIFETSVRNLEFEARDLDEATRLATTWGFGLVGEVEANEAAGTSRSVISKPDAYDVPSACLALGGISRTSLYRLLYRKILKRLPGTRKVLVTRRSMEDYCGRAA